MQDATSVIKQLIGALDDSRPAWRKGLATGFLCAAAGAVAAILTVMFVF